jgi:hypothetical protein
MAEVNQKRIDKARQTIQKTFDEVADVYPEMAIIAFKNGEYLKSEGNPPTLLVRGSVDFGQSVFRMLVKTKWSEIDGVDKEFVALASELSKVFYERYRKVVMVRTDTTLPTFEDLIKDTSNEALAHGWIEVGIVATKAISMVAGISDKPNSKKG